MKINSSLNFTIEHTVNKVMHPNQDVFDIYNLDKTIRLGTLVCHKSELPLRPNYEKSVLAIDFLEVTTKNEGLGTKILKFAEEYSKQIGCNGYLTVKADGSLLPQKIPHTFYRKFGFSTFDKKIDVKLDKFISKNINATIKDFPCLLMHYPPQPKKTTKFMQIVQYMCKKSHFSSGLKI